MIPVPAADVFRLPGRRLEPQTEYSLLSITKVHSWQQTIVTSDMSSYAGITDDLLLGMDCDVSSLCILDFEVPGDDTSVEFGSITYGELLELNGE